MADEPNTATTDGVEPNLSRPGSITYMQIPATDVRSSAAFYEKVFGWTVRVNPAHTSFMDANGHVAGAIVTDLKVSREPGVLPYIYVDAIDDVIRSIGENGGEIVRPRYDEGGLWVATFRDPAGNVLGVWQQQPG